VIEGSIAESDAAEGFKGNPVGRTGTITVLVGVANTVDGEGEDEVRQVLDVPQRWSDGQHPPPSDAAHEL
jgi:hypothetical protein